MLAKLKQGHSPISEQQWKWIRRAIYCNVKEPKSYVLSPETGLIEPDANLLLETNSNDVILGNTDAIKEFNSFITELNQIYTHIVSKLNRSKQTNDILGCFETIQHIEIQQLQENRRNYECQFTGVQKPTNQCVKLTYTHNNQFQQSGYFCVCDKYLVLLKALYLYKRITSELQNLYITRLQQPEQHQQFVQQSNIMFHSMNKAIPFAWEFVEPLATA